MFVKIFDLLFIGKPGKEKEIDILVELYATISITNPLWSNKSYREIFQDTLYDIHTYTHR